LDIVKEAFNLLHDVIAVFVPFEAFPWIPWLVFGLVLAGSLLLVRRRERNQQAASKEDTEAENESLTKKERRQLAKQRKAEQPKRVVPVRRIAFLRATRWFALTSLLIFLYIFLWPFDPRWGTSPEMLDFPGFNAPDLSGIPLLGDAANQLGESLEGAINQQTEVLEAQANSALMKAALVDGYINAAKVAGVYLAYAVIGALVAWRLNKSITKARQAMIANELENVRVQLAVAEAGAAAAQREVAKLTRTLQPVLNNLQDQELENFREYERQAVEYGHHPDVANGAYPFDASVDYRRQPQYYAKFAREVEERHAAKQASTQSN